MIPNWHVCWVAEINVLMKNRNISIMNEQWSYIHFPLTHLNNNNKKARHKKQKTLSQRSTTLDHIWKDIFQHVDKQKHKNTSLNTVYLIKYAHNFIVSIMLLASIYHGLDDSNLPISFRFT